MGSSSEEIARHHPDTERQGGLLALARGRFEEALVAFERSARRQPGGLSRYDAALARLALGADPERAGTAIDEELTPMELREQVDAARADFDLLARARPDLPTIPGLAGRVDARAATIALMEHEDRAPTVG